MVFCSISQASFKDMCSLVSSKLIAWILVLGLAQKTVVVAGTDVNAEVDVNVDNDDRRECECQSNCCNTNCVSGEMQVIEQSRGIIRVSDLSTSDVIRGITGPDRTPGWCKVDAINPTPNIVSDNVTSFDGFTENHMVVENGTVRPYGKRGKVRKGKVFMLATECDAAVNAEGQVFTPISTAFCPHELSWSEYLLLMAAIRRVTKRTGYFWYSLDVFHDNETAKVPFWRDTLHDMCIELLRCAREGQCQSFENVMEEFVHAHLNKPYMEIVDRAFPNMGGDVEKSEAGTMAELVRSRGRSQIPLFIAVGCAIALFLLIVLVAVLVYRLRVLKKKKQIKEPHPTHSSEDVKA